jgi:hypothetical protein
MWTSTQYNIINNNTKFKDQLEVEFVTTSIYRVSQEERSIFWEVIVSVILSKKLYMNMCPILNGFREIGRAHV